MNICYWILYYLKCLFNLCFSYLFNLYNFNNNLKLVNSLDNFSKINENLFMIKLNGSYYEMGKQYGKKFPNSVIKKDMSSCFKFINENQTYLMRNLPNKYKKKDIFKSLEVLFYENKKNFNPDWVQFIEGVSFETNIDVLDLYKCNLITDLIDNHCILLSKKINTKPFHLRTLDFGMPLSTQVLFVLSPSQKNSYCFLSFGSCYFGIVSGFSEKNIFFGESYYDNKLGQLSYIGMSFQQIAHHALSNSNSLKESQDCFKNMQKSSNLELLLADDDNSSILQCCYDYFNISQNLYDSSEVLSVTPNELKSFKKNKKNLNSIENIFKKFIPNTQSGELHIFAYYNDFLYISVTTNLFQSYNNMFYKFNVSDLFYNF